MPSLHSSISSHVINHINLAGPSASWVMLLLCLPGRQNCFGTILRWSKLPNVASRRAGTLLPLSLATVGCWISCTAQVAQPWTSFWPDAPNESSEELIGSSPTSESNSSWSTCLSTAHRRPLLILHRDLQAFINRRGADMSTRCQTIDWQHSYHLFMFPLSWWICSSRGSRSSSLRNQLQTGRFSTCTCKHSQT